MKLLKLILEIKKVNKPIILKRRGDTDAFSIISLFGKQDINKDTYVYEWFKTNIYIVTNNINPDSLDNIIEILKNNNIPYTRISKFTIKLDDRVNHKIQIIDNITEIKKVNKPIIIIKKGNSENGYDYYIHSLFNTKLDKVITLKFEGQWWVYMNNEDTRNKIIQTLNDSNMPFVEKNDGLIILSSLANDKIEIIDETN